jgi:hypothetical protein
VVPDGQRKVARAVPLINPDRTREALKQVLPPV